MKKAKELPKVEVKKDEDYVNSEEGQNFLKLIKEIEERTKNLIQESDGKLGILVIGYIDKGPEECALQMLARATNKVFKEILDGIFTKENFQAQVLEVLSLNPQLLSGASILEYLKEERANEEK